ncbi:MAG: tetratricopeptide repeat protein [Notoacmeibacter sp.]|nr:tetratricopeptide repeat protein [Notoacmeibacter sp.]
MYRKGGEFDQAITDLTKAVELDPQYDWAYAERGSAYSEQGEFDLAIADFTKAVEHNPQYYWAFGKRGEAHKEQGKSDLAIADFTKAIRSSLTTTGPMPSAGVCIARGEIST